MEGEMKIYHYKIIGGTQIEETVFDSNFLFHHDIPKLKFYDYYGIMKDFNRINMLIKASTLFTFFYSPKKIKKQDYDKLLKGIRK